MRRLTLPEIARAVDGMSPQTIKGPAGPYDYTLSRVDWYYVDKALTELAERLEIKNMREMAHEVRMLCNKFFDGSETVIRDVNES